MSGVEGYRYPGARPFHDTPLDREMFCGRSKESYALLHLALAEKLVVVFARSGLGKSSLINAGLLQSLRDNDVFPMPARVNDPDSGPMHTIYQDVEESINGNQIELFTVPGGTLETKYGLVCRGDPLPKGRLSEIFRDRAIPLWLFFKQARFWKGDTLQTPLLVIDQFEELFTLQAAENRDALVQQLADITRGRSDDEHGGGSPEAGGTGAPDLKILLSIREDWLGSLQELAHKIPGILGARFRLGPLERDNAHQAIVRPAAIEDERVHTPPFEYHPDAVEAILDFLCRRKIGGKMTPTNEVDPSQLQIICQHLEQLTLEPGHRPVITMDDLGGGRDRVFEVLEGVLEHFYEQQTAKAAGRLRVRQVRKLCETGLVVEGRRVSLDQAVIRARYGVSAEELRRLADLHVLRAVPRLDSVYYELSHDTLVEPVLAARARRVRSTRRTALFSAAVAVFLALVVTGYFVADLVMPSKELRLRSFLDEVEDARVDLDTDPVPAMIRLVDLASAAPEVTGRELPAKLRLALSQAVHKVRETRAIPLPHPQQADTSALSARGERVVELGGDGALWIRAFGGRTTPLGEGSKSPTRVATDPTGRRIAAITDNGKLTVWDDDGNRLRELVLPYSANETFWLGFDPKPCGESYCRLAALSTVGRLAVWDVARGDDRPEVRDLPLPAEELASLAWGTRPATEGFVVVATDKAGRLVILNDEAAQEERSNVSNLSAVALRTDGKMIAAADDRGILRLWDLNGSPVGEPFGGGLGAVTSLSFSADGSRLASGGADGKIRIWNLEGEPVQVEQATHSDSAAVSALASSSDDTWLASGGTGGNVRLWDWDGVTEGVPLKGHRGKITAIAFDPSSCQAGSRNCRIASSSKDGTVRLWDVERDLTIDILDYGAARGNEIECVAFSSSGSFLVTGAADGVVRRQALGGEGPPEEIGDHGGSAVLSVAFSPDKRYVVSGGRDGQVRVWDLTREGEEIAKLGDFRRYVHFVAFSRPESGNPALVAASYGGTVQVVPERHLGTAQPRYSTKFTVHQSYLTTVALLPDLTQLVTASSDGKLQRWELDPKNKSWEPQTRPFGANDLPINKVSVSRQKTIASASVDGTMYVWDFDGNRVIDALRGHDSEIVALEFDESGNGLWSLDRDYLRAWDVGLVYGKAGVSEGDKSALATGFVDEKTIYTVRTDGTLSHRSITGISLEEFSGELEDDITTVAFSPGGWIAAGRAGGSLTLWNANGSPRRGLRCLSDEDAESGVEIAALALDRNADRVFCGNSKGEVWRLGRTNGQELVMETASDPSDALRTLAVDVSGTTLASGWSSGAVRVYRLTDDDTELMSDFTAHDAPVTALAIRGNSTVVSAGADHQVSFWDLQGKSVAVSTVMFDAPVVALSFDAEEQDFVGQASDGRIRVLHPREDWLREACQRLRDHPRATGTSAKAFCERR